MSALGLNCNMGISSLARDPAYAPCIANAESEWLDLWGSSKNTFACMPSCFSHVRLFATLWTVAHQAPLSMALSRQEHWSGLLFPSPGHLPHPGIEPGSPTSQADSLPSEPSGKLARLNLMVESGDQERRRSLRSFKCLDSKQSYCYFNPIPLDQNTFKASLESGNGEIYMLMGGRAMSCWHEENEHRKEGSLFILY